MAHAALEVAEVTWRLAGNEVHHGVHFVPHAVRDGLVNRRPCVCSGSRILGNIGLVLERVEPSVGRDSLLVQFAQRQGLLEMGGHLVDVGARGLVLWGGIADLVLQLADGFGNREPPIDHHGAGLVSVRTKRISVFIVQFGLGSADLLHKISHGRRSAERLPSIGVHLAGHGTQVRDGGLNILGHAARAARQLRRHSCGSHEL